MLPAQATAITSVLDQLPPEFPTDVVDHAQQLMVDFAATHNSAELRRLTGRLLEVLAPGTAEELEAARLEREERQARRNRHVVFTPDHHGSILIKGSLPRVAAEPLIRIVEAYAAAERRALDGLDPNAEYLTPAMRRADGLLAMVNHHTQQVLAPAHGGDRPRISVILSYDTLVKTARDAGLLTGVLASTGESIPASTLRQLLCDADLLPVVFGGPSEVLDVGTTQRFVTPIQRAALRVRDGGCAFPGCDKPPQDCHAHHIVPWWDGGPTDLENLASCKICPRLTDEDESATFATCGSGQPVDSVQSEGSMGLNEILGIAGLAISVLGFAVTIWQLARTRKAAVATKDAVVQANRRMLLNHLLVLLPQLRTLESELDAAIATDDHPAAIKALHSFSYTANQAAALLEGAPEAAGVELIDELRDAAINASSNKAALVGGVKKPLQGVLKTVSAQISHVSAQCAGIAAMYQVKVQ